MRPANLAVATSFHNAEYVLKRTASTPSRDASAWAFIDTEQIMPRGHINK